MTYTMDGQVSMFDLVMPSTKTSPERSAATAAKTGKQSSRSLSGSSSRTPLMCLCLKREAGPTPGVSTAKWGGGQLPIGCMTLNIGEFHSAENGLLSAVISTALPQRKFYLTLNCGEKPRVPNPTKLSEILQPDADPKYRLSPLACRGILNRAERRGKELPKALLDALTAQARTDADLDALTAQAETDSVSKNEPGNQGGAKDCSCNMNTSEPCQRSKTSQSSQEVEAFGVCSFDSNAMKSPNPHSGFYKADTSRTLDLNGGNPACNQGGVLAVAPPTAVDCRNGTENPFVNGTLQAKEQGMNLNSNNVVRVLEPNLGGC